MRLRVSGGWPPVLVALVLGLALLPGALEAQQADLITGQVTRADGTPIPGARVEVVSAELETTRSTVTDGRGRYTILFPDGGGLYVVRVSFLGKADAVLTVMRRGEEELLMQDVAMQPEAIVLEGVEVRVRGGTPGQGGTGEQSVDLSQDLLNRLPLADLDPATVALLVAGVVATELDSISGQMGFSVGGMDDLLNQITLDGIDLGPDGLGVPEEGVRRTQVTTNTFDVSRGGFAGGQVNMTSARGSNRSGGAFSYRLDDDALQMSSAATTNAFTRQNFGGSWGGPIVSNQLFYNASFQIQQNRNHRFALSPDDPLSAQRSGVALDSVARFIDILEGAHALPALGHTGSYDQVSRDLRLSGRMDWNVAQSSAGSHSLSTRVNLNLSGQDSTRISALDLAERGGDMERDNQLLAMTLSSRFRTSWTHRITASARRSTNESVPFTEMPEGRVRVTSEWEDGLRDARTLSFGGNRNMPTEARSTDLQLSNELSFLQPVGSHLHRIKAGGSIQRERSVNRSSDNLFGSFSYASLDDFEANLPDRFERTLTQRESSTERVNAGLFLGDTWRISQPLELTLGVRWDYSALNERPEYNPAVEAAFGRRTDVRPAAAGVSPRIGFSYQLDSGSSGLQLPGMGRSLSGGLGVFAGRAPVQVFSQAYRQTGLPSAEQRLVCIGDAVPIPDWTLYGQSPASIPEVCADGELGTPPGFSSRAPNVTLMAQDQRLPSSLRADLGYRTQLLDRLPVTLRYTYSRGFGLWGYRDINLDESRSFELAGEGRPFFGDPTQIVPRTGAVSSAGSRLDGEFGNVFEVISDLGSASHQFSVQLMGALSPSTTAMASYTLGYARDEGSAGGGMGRFGGGGGGLLPPTAAGPNDREWATSSNDRRHSLNLTLSHAFRPDVQVSLLGRVSSGTPFTPMVNRDISGDGLRNNRAFVFDPATAADPEVALGMERLLDSAPARVVSCLEGQLGRIADRNSCRNGWTQSLDLRVSLRPELPRLDRRLTVSLDANNVLTGLDQLVNGSQEMRGWGAGGRADPTLLQVTGFDADTRSFSYQVNESFGQDRRGVNALRNPFAIRISARVALGGLPGRNNRGFGASGGGGFGGMGGAFMGGGRMGGGMGGTFGGGGRGGFAGAASEGAAGIGQLLGAVLRGETPDVQEVLDGLLPNPARTVLEMADTLALSPDQRDGVGRIADALDEGHRERRDVMAPVVEELLSELGGTAERGGGGGARGALAGLGALQGVQRELTPQLTEARDEIREAMVQVREILTPVQWEELPPELRNAGTTVPVEERGGGPRRRPPGGG